MEKLLSQLPDAFDLMGRVIRAGQTMSQGLQAVADEFAPPIATEFSYCYEQQNLGLSPELAMRDLARRTGLLEIKIFVTAMLVQQQTGGNLAEMLDKLSAIIRQRYRLRGQIKALTAEGRFQAAVLLALPIVMFFVFLVLNPAYEAELLKHPSLIVATLVCEGHRGAMDPQDRQLRLLSGRGWTATSEWAAATAPSGESPAVAHVDRFPNLAVAIGHPS